MNRLLPVLIFVFSSTIAFSQVSHSSELYKTLKEKDSLLFTIGFNHCDISQFERLLSNSFEFYHDQSGITPTKVDFISGIKNGLCQMAYKAERKLVDSSLSVFPLYKNGVLYGAIQTGEHSFYAIEKNGSSHLTSNARFTHVWLLEKDDWKLSRGLSYDHQVFDKPQDKNQVNKKK
jgi:hypothetical protein